MITLRKTKRGFTLVELMIVVAIIGVLAALAIYGVKKYVASAKSAEARNAIGRIAKDASSSYNREGMPAGVLALGGQAASSNAICTTAATTVPAAATGIKGTKFQSSPAEWAKGSQTAGWACLKFSMQDPQYFMYGYSAVGSSALGDSFTATANGDLNGDGVLSVFSMTGSIQKDASGSGGLMVTLAPNLLEQNPEE